MSYREVYKRKENIEIFKYNIFIKNIATSSGFERNIFTDINNRFVTRNETKFKVFFIVKNFHSVSFLVKDT